MNRKRATAAVLAVLVVIAVALTAWTSLAGASSARQTGTLTGAGSTFVAPLVAKWQANYKPSKIVYSPIGSGGGIAAITARTVDFGASDAPLTKDQFSACRGCVQIPWTFSASPFQLFKVLANMAGLVLLISGVQIFLVNRRFLPREVRPAPWREVLLLGCSAFYGYFTFFVIRDVLRMLRG